MELCMRPIFAMIVPLENAGGDGGGPPVAGWGPGFPTNPIAPGGDGGGSPPINWGGAPPYPDIGLPPGYGGGGGPVDPGYGQGRPRPAGSHYASDNLRCFVHHH
jgi:hypothetical protein